MKIKKFVPIILLFIGCQSQPKNEKNYTKIDLDFIIQNQKSVGINPIEIEKFYI